MLELLLWLAACRCDGGTTPLPAPDAHYAEFDHLVDLAAMGSVAPARELARDLDVADDDAKLASAAGYTQTALDAEELADGVAAMAAACGACHAQDHVTTSTARPPFDHEHAARWAIWGLVWGPQEADSESKAAQAIAACSSCHAKAPGAR